MDQFVFFCRALDVSLHCDNTVTTPTTSTVVEQDATDLISYVSFLLKIAIIPV